MLLMFVSHEFPQCFRSAVLALLLTLPSGMLLHAREEEPASDQVAEETSVEDGQEELPLPVSDYPGRAADAEWRKAATERIETIRKADLTVVVTDGEGKAIKEAEVVVKLKQHAFLFGTTVSVEFAEEGEGGGPTVAPNAELPAGPGYDDETRATYREKLLSLFNTATPLESSEVADEKLENWLRVRGFLPEPDGAVSIPASLTLETLVPPEQLWEDLEKLSDGETPLAAMGYALPVDVTDPAQLQLQADYTRDFFTVLFSHPRVREISIAGFWAPTSDVRGWALFDEHWALRPVGQAFVDLTTKIWSTDETALTDAAGKVKIRGFLGHYRVSVSFGARTQTVTAELLSADGAEVEIKLD
jgi:hypothetical protein